MVNVSKLIEQLLETYLKNGFKNAADINCGYCQDFAEELVGIINAVCDPKIEGYANAFWDSDYCHCESVHCFVEFDGLFYDSETPEGVEHPSDLPIYQRLKDCYDLTNLFAVVI